MLSKEQIKYRDDFLSPLMQRLFYLKSLPMGLISGIRITHLDEEKAIAEVPYRWRNKNPFRSIYFAVQSMAAELSTAAPVFMALKGIDENIAFIIVGMKAEFVKKAQFKVTFSCLDYEEIYAAISKLNQPDDTATITAKSIGKDVNGDEVAIFYFTWSFKIRS